jgi:acetaldehyde dehydrogenase
MDKVKIGIIGPGNIGSDLMYKVMKSKHLEMHMMAGRRISDGILRAEKLGFKISTEAAEGIAADPDIKIVFDATSAKAHEAAAPILKAAGIIAIDLTPAAVGPYVVPCVNLDKLTDEVNFNMVTCGGQAVVPIAYAINRAAESEYTGIVSCIASKSAGPGTRANIDEFTETTAKALRVIGGADRSKAIIILNPAEPPLIMTNTIYSLVRNPDEKKIVESVNDIIRDVQAYVPGYRLRVPPLIDGNKVTVIIEVEGAADFLPSYSGNLDIINQGAVAVAEKLAAKMLGAA